MALVLALKQIQPEEWVGKIQVQVGHTKGVMDSELSPHRGQSETHFVLPASLWMRNSSLAPRNLPTKNGKNLLEVFCSQQKGLSGEILLLGDKTQLPGVFPSFFQVPPRNFVPSLPEE